MIEALHRLAERDEEILQLRRRLDPYRARLEALTREHEDAEKARILRDEKLNVERKNLRSLEGDLKTAEDRIVAETKKIDAVTSMKAATAMEHELAALTKKKDEIEEKMLEVMERIETFEKDSVAVPDDERADLLKEIAAVESEIADRIAVIEGERALLLAEITPEWRARYDSLDVPNPISRADAGACIKCRGMLKPNSLSKLTAGVPAVCENCKRILLPN